MGGVRESTRAGGEAERGGGGGEREGEGNRERGRGTVIGRVERVLERSARE